MKDFIITSEFLIILNMIPSDTGWAGGILGRIVANLVIALLVLFLIKEFEDVIK